MAIGPRECVCCFEKNPPVRREMLQLRVLFAGRHFLWGALEWRRGASAGSVTRRRVSTPVSLVARQGKRESRGPAGFGGAPDAAGIARRPQKRRAQRKWVASDRAERAKREKLGYPNSGGGEFFFVVCCPPAVAVCTAGFCVSRALLVVYFTKIKKNSH